MDIIIPIFLILFVVGAKLLGMYLFAKMINK